MNVSTEETIRFGQAKGERSARLYGLQRWLLLLCFLVVALDGFDTAAIGFVAPALAKEFYVSRAALGPLISIALFGMTTGALAAGPIADRIGRKPVLISSVLLFGFCTLGCAVANSLSQLTLLRALTGLGLGGAMPTAGTLLSEYLPSRKKGFFTNLMYCGFPLGASAGGFLAAAMIPQFGWSAVFLVGGIVPLVIGVALFTVPESIRFMQARDWSADRISRVTARLPDVTFLTSDGPHAEAGMSHATPATLAIMSSRFRLGTLMLWVAYFMGLLVFYLQTSWLPTLLTDAHFTLQRAATIAAFMPFGGVLGTFIFGFLLDALPPFRVVATTFTLAAVSLLVASHSLSSAALLSLVLFFSGFLLVGSQSSMLALAMIFYPTTCRATGGAWMLGIGRLGGITGALIGGLMIKSGLSTEAMIGWLAPALFIAAIALLIGHVANRRSAPAHR